MNRKLRTKAEYSRGNAKCKKCNEQIEKGALRMVELKKV